MLYIGNGLYINIIIHQLPPPTKSNKFIIDKISLMFFLCINYKIQIYDKEIITYFNVASYEKYIFYNITIIVINDNVPNSIY